MNKDGLKPVRKDCCVICGWSEKSGVPHPDDHVVPKQKATTEGDDGSPEEKFRELLVWIDANKSLWQPKALLWGFELSENYGGFHCFVSLGKGAIFDKKLSTGLLFEDFQWFLDTIKTTRLGVKP